MTTSVAYARFRTTLPLTEADPVRGVAGFSYARDKTESASSGRTHPERVMTIVRPCIVFGPNVDNYLVRLWTKQPFTVDVGNLDNEIQFVHEDDVVEAVTGLLLGRHAGAYNVAGKGRMTLRECGELIGTPVRQMPLWLYRGLARVMWGVGPRRRRRGRSSSPSTRGSYRGRSSSRRSAGDPAYEPRASEATMRAQPAAAGPDGFERPAATVAA